MVSSDPVSKSDNIKIRPYFVRHQVGNMFAILVVISVLYPVANVISALVKEKELRIKEGLKMMGLTGAAHTASWVFHFACLFFFTSLLMVLTSRSVFEFRCVSCAFSVGCTNSNQIGLQGTCIPQSLRYRLLTLSRQQVSGLWWPVYLVLLLPLRFVLNTSTETQTRTSTPNKHKSSFGPLVGVSCQ